MKLLRFSYFLIVLTISAMYSSLVFTSIANAAPRLSSSVIANWEGPRSGKEGTYLCTKAKCGGLSVVVYENDRMSSFAKRQFERAKKDRKRLDRSFRLGFKFGNAFSRTKIEPVGGTQTIKIGKFDAVTQALKVKGKTAAGLKDGYAVIVIGEKRQHTFAAIAASPSKAKSLAIRFAKGLRF